MTLDRAQVVKAAIDLLDEVGLDALTLRRLATDLGVQAPALYWHFKNKQELLDQMAATISTTEAPLRPPAASEGWDDWLAQHARAMRASLNRHRDGAMLAASTRPRPEQWRDIDEAIGVLVDAGMTAADALRALFTIGDYVSGFALEEQADRMRGATADNVDPAAFEKALALFADHPRLTEALREAGDPRSDSSFEAGLRVILDGLRQRASRAAG